MTTGDPEPSGKHAIVICSDAQSTPVTMDLDKIEARIVAEVVARGGTVILNFKAKSGAVPNAARLMSLISDANRWPVGFVDLTENLDRFAQAMRGAKVSFEEMRAHIPQAVVDHKKIVYGPQRHTRKGKGKRW